MKNITVGLCAALALFTAVLAGCGNGDSAGVVSISDNFEDGQKDIEKWGDDVGDTDRTAFTERGGKLEFTGTGGYVDRPWIATHFPYAHEWEVQMDVENVHDLASERGDIAALGLLVFSSTAPENFFRFELYTDPGRSQRGFYVDLYEEGYPDTINNEHDLPGLTDGSLRVRFDPATKVLSLFFDVSQADADDWIPFTTISVGDTNAQQSVDWSMSETGFFSISVYAIGVRVEEGDVRADNFTTVGGFRP